MQYEPDLVQLCQTQCNTKYWQWRSSNFQIIDHLLQFANCHDRFGSCFCKVCESYFRIFFLGQIYKFSFQILSCSSCAFFATGSFFWQNCKMMSGGCQKSQEDNRLEFCNSFYLSTQISLFPLKYFLDWFCTQKDTTMFFLRCWKGRGIQWLSQFNIGTHLNLPSQLFCLHSPISPGQMNIIGTKRNYTNCNKVWQVCTVASGS